MLIWHTRYVVGGSDNLYAYLCCIYESKAYIKKLCGSDIDSFYYKNGSLKLKYGIDGTVGCVILSNHPNVAKLVSLSAGTADTTGYTQVTIDQ